MVIGALRQDYAMVILTTRMMLAVLPNSRVWFPYLVGAIPIIVTTAAILWEQRNRKLRFQSPQAEKLLRPPGYSLSIKLDQIVDRLTFEFLAAFGLCVIAGAFFDAAMRIPAAWSIVFAVVGLVAGAGGAYAASLVLRDYRDGLNCRLGLRGEQAVAEALQEVADCGYRAFHDIPGGEDWNIDHVVVGPPGVFLIETKARNRVRSKLNQPRPAHVVHVIGSALRFPSGDDVRAIPQAGNNAKWLAGHLTKKTGEKVDVEAIVALPGWFFEIKEPPPRGTSVMNATYLVGHLRRQSIRLSESQVRRITAALDEKCRDVEF